MFQSATLKLTGWYLLILMSISLIFSVAIYSVASQEVGNRLQDLQSRYESAAPSNQTYSTLWYEEYRDRQYRVANTNLLLSLAYVNFFIFVAGGVGSYGLARRTLREIEETHESQSRFTSDASHELRTPLAVMKSEIEVVLRDKTASKAELRDTLQSNLEEVDKLSRLSKVLLQLSKVDTSDIPMRVLSLQPIIEAAIKRHGQQATRITLTASSNTPLIYGNNESVEELCMILIDNALKYSPPESGVTIHLSRRGNRASIAITNSGKGIDPRDLPHIFDRFYRADQSRTNGDQSGHGLGLSLAKKIIDIHHGELLASSGTNQNTTFTALFPAVKKPSAKQQ